ncbi:MAP7 domain-containing protein 2-like isoform X2 [Zerene cesonia]|uniref:MAP7 domain-containing protein 2-like isoform X2 n=1 Tax=Zerene cesonia TaxID=33412 RepID=UPI0018E5861A|nr:MAP7 domain-containing protein 2-like isoform X2 [Zerene cesonia]
MVDDVKDITEKAESKEALDRARLARERREAEQRKRLDELRAHAAAAQAQREKRDEDRRKRQAEQRARDDDRRQQEVISENSGPITNGKVEERKRAIWEASISRREALLQREKDRTERLERARAARSAPRPAFAFGSSTPRLLEPVDSAGFFWAARSTNPIDQMNFFESLAASTTNVMFASAPLTRRASALQLDTSDTDNKDEAERSPAAAWTSVARRRTDLVPTVPAPRAPGRAYSMTRLDRLPARPLHSASPSMHHLNRSQGRSGDTTPGSRPGSALSGGGAGVVRRASSAPRKPRPASIAGTGCNTPRGEAGSASAASTPAVSRDGSTVARAQSAPRRPRPLSLHVAPAPPPPRPAAPLGPGEGKPPVHRKPKPAKEQEKKGGKSLSVSPGPRDLVVDDMSKSVTSEIRQVDAQEVTQKLEALQVTDDAPAHNNTIENVENIEAKIETNTHKVQENRTEEKVEVQKETQKEIQKETQKVEPKKEPSVEKTEENEMTASMISRRITTEEEAKAALAERRRRAREELERQAELERLRLQREAEEEAERQRQEEERQRREEEEARELAALQRRLEEEKLQRAIEAQQQLEREEGSRRAREEAERAARARDELEKRRAGELAERRRAAELEREERERLARKQRVEAIMARTRLKKQAEEDKKKQEQEQKPAESQTAADTQKQAQANDAPKQDGAEANSDAAQPAETVQVAGLPQSAYEITENSTATAQPESAHSTDDADAQPKAESVQDGKVESPVEDNVASVTDNFNGNVQTADLLSLATSQPEENPSREPPAERPHAAANNGNVTADLLGLSDDNESKDTTGEQSSIKQIDNASQPEANNGNVAHVGHISANFIQTERMAEHNQKIEKLLDDDFTTHNGHGLNHPLTLQNAI